MQLIAPVISRSMILYVFRGSRGVCCVTFAFVNIEWVYEARKPRREAVRTSGADRKLKSGGVPARIRSSRPSCCILSLSREKLPYISSLSCDEEYMHRTRGMEGILHKWLIYHEPASSLAPVTHESAKLRNGRSAEQGEPGLWNVLTYIFRSSLQLFLPS